MTKDVVKFEVYPQTMSPYIHESNGLCTRTDHHILLPIVLYMVVPLCYK